MMLIYHVFTFSGGDLFQKILNKKDLKFGESNSAPLRSMQNIEKCTYQAQFLRRLSDLISLLDRYGPYFITW